MVPGGQLGRGWSVPEVLLRASQYLLGTEHVSPWLRVLPLSLKGLPAWTAYSCPFTLVVALFCISSVLLSLSPDPVFFLTTIETSENLNLTSVALPGNALPSHLLLKVSHFLRSPFLLKVGPPFLLKGRTLERELTFFFWTLNGRRMIKMLLCEEEALVNKASTLWNCYDSLEYIYLNDRGSSKINGSWFGFLHKYWMFAIS